jgi:hypothetical protein
MLICAGCRQTTYKCDDVLPYQYFNGKGYILYFKDSEDGMREILFFPLCQKKDVPSNNDEFPYWQFKSGISFKIPITGVIYKKISAVAKEYTLKDSARSNKMYYCAAWIEINKPENSTPQYSKGENFWTLYLNLPHKEVKLSYFISNNSNVQKIEPTHSK